MVMITQRANNRFAVNVFQQLIQGRAENIFISGFSLYNALGMLAIGAEGEAYNELVNLLQWDSLGNSEQEILEKYRVTQETLTASSGVLFHVANSVWTNSFRTEYKQQVQQQFGAKAFPLTTSEEINNWTAQQTNQMIKTIVPELPSACPGVLVNAIYFQGKWNTSFPVRNTTPAQFQRANKELVTVPMMHVKGNFRGLLDSEWGSAIEMPYVGKEYSMVAMMPRRDQNWEEFIQLKPSYLKGLMSTLRPVKDLKVSFPKFRLEFGVKELTEELQALGIQRVFAPGSLSRMSNDPSTSITSVFHKAVCIVNEEGTEASAATAVVTRCIVKENRINFNKPFAFLILHRSSNLILFTGIVENPLPS